MNLVKLDREQITELSDVEQTVCVHVATLFRTGVWLFAVLVSSLFVTERTGIFAKHC